MKFLNFSYVFIWVASSVLKVSRTCLFHYGNE